MTDYRVQVYARDNLAWEGTITAVSSEADASSAAKAELPYGDVANYRTAVTPVPGTDQEEQLPSSPSVEVPVSETVEAEQNHLEDVVRNLPADVLEYIKSLGK